MIDAALVRLVADAVAAAPARTDFAATQAELRRGFPDLRIVVCSDDDIPPKLPPAAENGRCRLYYLDASEHCVKLTRDADAASGIVVGLLDGRDD